MKRLIFIFCMIAAPLWAVQPDEILKDAGLEMRARDISKGLRCLVCRNENIDDSRADLARDLRLLVRERLMAGDDDAAVVDFIVARYGEYVLLKPGTSGSNMLLWAAGPLMLFFGGAIALIYVRRRSAAGDDRLAELSDDEKARLAEIMNE